MAVGRRDREAYNAYMRGYKRAWYARRRAEAVAALGGKCVRCGATDKLEIDHVDASEKKHSVGALFNGSYIKAQEELKKCQLLCGKCHAEKSAESGDHVSSGSGRNKIINPEHGTSVMYHRERCRCEVCRVWKKRSRHLSSVGRAAHS